MENHNICIGIDLGTTNSAIAWGGLDNKGELIDPQTIQIPMLTTDRTIDKKDLLPSCVYFPERDHLYFDTKPIVGEYANATGLTGDVLENRVARSIKLKMGQREPVAVDGNGKKYTPVDISRLILEKLKMAAEQMLFRNIDFPEDVAIAYPASFEKEPEMLEATKQASKQAGFKNVEFVTEPIAALHYFWERYYSGQIPEKQFVLNKPELWLVFDLGGGTLDVVLYVVYTKNKGRELQIDHIETGRFTKIGGDKFDEKVADFLLKEYKKNLSSNELKACNDEILKIEFQLHAEQAKCDLSRLALSDELASEEITADVYCSPDGENIFAFNLSLCKYRECVARYLANTGNLKKLETAFNHYDDSHRSENIIDPILDVLKKGQEKLRTFQEQPNSIPNGSDPIWNNTEFYQGKTEPDSVLKPDTVLLSGSMTRLPIISERLEGFFGSSVKSVVNPELAVAHGAVIYMIKERYL